MLGDPRRPPGAGPDLPPTARIPAIPRRPVQPQQRARMAGRDPQQPYVNQSASLASLARHMFMGIDKSKLETTVKTHELVLLLEHVMTIGFGGEASQKMAAELKTIYDTAVASNQAMATEGLKDG